MKKKIGVLVLALSLCIGYVAIREGIIPIDKSVDSTTEQVYATSPQRDSFVSLSDIPKYSGKPYVKVNNNQPFFKSKEYTDKSFEKYQPLDSLGRCGVAYACIGQDTMPTEKRGSIGMVKPSGWHTVRYNDLISDRYLYNRCHLIGYQLTGENANQRNLITGTRYLNVTGMLPFEDKVAEYVKNTKNHVLYRVTPIFKNRDLVARGVLMEGYSIEDNGKGINFNVYCYNVQPGIKITYKTGDSCRAKDGSSGASAKNNGLPSAANNSYKEKYVLNLNTKKFHRTTCGSVKHISGNNKKITSETRKSIINSGYDPCGACNP